MSASPLSPARRRQACLLLAGLAAASARPARAADDAVRIACTELTVEQAAEIESRVRASLLTSEGEAAVVITCGSSSADVRVDRASDSVVIATPTSPASLRDDLLRAVEQALEELRQRQAHWNEIDANRAAPALTPAPIASAEPPPPPPPAPNPRPVTPPTLTPASATNEPASIEILGAFVLESWPDHGALGGALGVARRTRALWYGLRAAALRPSLSAASFDAVEAHVAAEVGVQPDFAAGVRLSLALGPSLLFVQPKADLTPRRGTTKASLFAALHVSRAIWLGRFALLPQLGLRLFANDRGVNVDAQPQLVLGGLAPQLSMGVVYRID